MKMFKNMMWMAAGMGAGFAASYYSKDIKSFMKKGKREMTKAVKNTMSDN